MRGEPKETRQPRSRPIARRSSSTPGMSMRQTGWAFCWCRRTAQVKRFRSSIARSPDHRGFSKRASIWVSHIRRAATSRRPRNNTGGCSNSRRQDRASIKLQRRCSEGVNSRQQAGGRKRQPEAGTCELEAEARSSANKKRLAHRSEPAALPFASFCILEAEPESDLTDALLGLLEVAREVRRLQEVRVHLAGSEQARGDEARRVPGIHQVEDLADRFDARGAEEREASRDAQVQLRPPGATPAVPRLAIAEFLDLGAAVRVQSVERVRLHRDVISLAVQIPVE